MSFLILEKNQEEVLFLKINNSNSDGYILQVVGYKSNWLKINKITNVDGMEIENFEGWIHKSIIGASITHTTNLFNKPNGQRIGKLIGELVILK